MVQSVQFGIRNLIKSRIFSFVRYKNNLDNHFNIAQFKFSIHQRIFFVVNSCTYITQVTHDQGHFKIKYPSTMYLDNM